MKGAQWWDISERSTMMRYNVLSKKDDKLHELDSVHNSKWYEGIYDIMW